MKYPIGIQSFKELREEGFVYVDKTARLYELTSGGKYYFLSRPRRFGKSLLLSTMRAYFEGKKELFKGLALERLERDWTPYPVLYLDLNSGKYDTVENLEKNLDIILAQWESVYGVFEAEKTLEARFKGIVQRACEKTGRKVVILVDEYDKPVLAAIDDEPLQEQFRRTLKALYSVLKTQDQYIRFAFLTGVSKFSRLSIFSDLNNLEDITLDERYADICGISEEELHAYFEDSIKALAHRRKLTYDEACARLKEMYNGYHFAPGAVGMYNPFSLLNTLKSKTIGNYWFQTGTPTFLVKMLRKNDYDLKHLQLDPVPEMALGGVDSMHLSAIPLLYQTGYLTIKGYNEFLRSYRLGFPNREVEEGFMQSLLPMYTNGNQVSGASYITRFVTDLMEGRPDSFLSSLKTFLDDSDYRVAGKLEIYFQNTMYIIFRLMGFYTQVERATSQGRIDVVVHTKDYVYVIELKVDATAAEALAQIDTKEYLLPFAADGRKLYKIGVGFSSEKRSVSEWKCEGVSSVIHHANTGKHGEGLQRSESHEKIG